jgi:2-C-methyl-D-erythritol 4-phosphate cytidylyltransferase
MGGVDKVLVPLAGVPLVIHSLRVFQEAAGVDSIALVLTETNVRRGAQLVADEKLTKVSAIVKGGARRQDSVANGLQSLDRCDVVLVHDGARPLVDPDVVSRGLEAVTETGAASAAVPVTDTIKIAGADDMVVSETLDRGSLWSAQTPQVFRSDLLAEAHRAVADDVTDDAAMVETLGGKVKLFLGSYQNIKVTTPEDISLAQSILEARQSARGP